MLLIFKGLAAVCHSFYIYFSLYKRYSHKSFIHKHSLRPISLSSQMSAQWGEIRTRACLTASQRATKWNTLDNNLSIVYLVQVSMLLFCQRGLRHFFTYRLLLPIVWRIVQILRQRRRKTSSSSSKPVHFYQCTIILHLWLARMTKISR
jgi:hypothetical protein